MQLSIRGHQQFDLPGQILRLRLSTGFLSEGVICKLEHAVFLKINIDQLQDDGSSWYDIHDNLMVRGPPERPMIPLESALH